MTQLNVFATGGSGWVVEILKQLQIKTACGNVTGGSYIETPPILKRLKLSIFNVVNKLDTFSFLYCIAAAFFPFIGRPHSAKIHTKLWNLCLSTRSWCHYLCLAFLTLKSEITAQSMFISWRTPS